MSVVIVKYQDNFADNLSEIAYCNIIEKNSNKNWFFENKVEKRDPFEKKMANFNIDYKYISSNKVQSIIEKSYFFTRKLIQGDKINKEIKSKNKADKFLDIKHFKIDDISLISDSTKNSFRFNNYDFIVNFDILDEITSNNSIGLYCNKNDVDEIDKNYIYNSANRLNKYLKKPCLYIFANKKFDLEPVKMNLDYKFLNLVDWREEFYFLTKTKNKIILSNQNSYSEGFWASILNDKNYLTVFNKEIKPKNIPENWLAV